MARRGVSRLRHLRHNRLRGLDRGTAAANSRLKTLYDWKTAKSVAWNGTATVNAATAVNATNLINDPTHGLVTGDGPIDITGTLPVELEAFGPAFYPNVDDASNFYVTNSKQAAFDGNILAFTDDGTGLSWLNGESPESIIDRMRDGVRPVTIEATADADNV